MIEHSTRIFFFFFNDTATTEIYTLSLHDALPISIPHWRARCQCPCPPLLFAGRRLGHKAPARSEEHTSELQSHSDLVCRLLLEKKKSSWAVEHPPNSRLAEALPFDSRYICI